MEKLVLIALIGAVTAVRMKEVRQEYALLIGGATAALLLGEAVLHFSGLAALMNDAWETYRVPAALCESALKILGIAYLCDFGVHIAKDAGQQTVAVTLLIGGKILVLSCALPAAVTLLELGAALLKEAGA
jgi:Stage III sporulation protein AC/AD protein family.